MSAQEFTGSGKLPVFPDNVFTLPTKSTVINNQTFFNAQRSVKLGGIILETPSAPTRQLTVNPFNGNNRLLSKPELFDPNRIFFYRKNIVDLQVGFGCE